MNDFAIKRVEELNLKEYIKPKCHVLDTVEFSDIVSRVKNGEIERVVFYVRHSERPEIDVNDQTFGAHLGLTDYGVKLAHEVGAALRGIPNLVAYASPARRTILTAQEIVLS